MSKQISESNHMFSNRKLFLLLIPIIAEQFLTSLMGMADSMMVSTVGPAALSGVSLVDAVNLLVVQAFNAMATGGVIICSNYIGQKNLKKANDSARQVLLVSLSISLFMTILGLIFRTSLLSLIFGEVEADVMRASQIYFLLTIISYPFVSLAAASSAIFRAQANTGLPMKIAIISNMLNVVGNAVLIYVFRMGVRGCLMLLCCWCFSEARRTRYL